MTPPLAPIEVPRDIAGLPKADIHVHSEFMSKVILREDFLDLFQEALTEVQSEFPEFHAVPVIAATTSEEWARTMLSALDRTRACSPRTASTSVECLIAARVATRSYLTGVGAWCTGRPRRNRRPFCRGPRCY